MTTRTITEIINKCVAVIEALPVAVTEPQGRGFRLNRAPSRPLRRWIPDAGGNGMLRLFDIVPRDRQDIGTQNFQVSHVSQRVSITLAYPSEPKIYGLRERFDLDALVSSDLHQIKDALQMPASLAGSGHVANFVLEIPDIDRADEKVWFAEINLDAVFFTAKRSTPA